MDKIAQSTKPHHKWVQISTKRFSRRLPECISINSKTEK